MPSTAFAITLAAKNILNMQQSGKFHLLLQDQFCSAIYPWQDLCVDSSRKSHARGRPLTQRKARVGPDGVLERLDDNVVATCLPRCGQTGALGLEPDQSNLSNLKTFGSLSTGRQAVVPCTIQISDHDDVLHSQMAAVPPAPLFACHRSS
jgi:hypothetical protein